jgi:hypothetical protein
MALLAAARAAFGDGNLVHLQGIRRGPATNGHGKLNQAELN